MQHRFAWLSSHRLARATVGAMTAPLLLRFFSPAGAAILIAVLALVAARPWSDGNAVAGSGRTIVHEHQALGAALGDVAGDDLTASVVRLVVALQPTATPTPTRTPVPRPTPEPMHVQAPPPSSQPAPASQEPPSPPAPQSGCSASMGPLSNYLFTAMNRERVNRGIAPLAVHSCATRVAYIRASDMASRGYFSHTNPEGQTAFTLLDSFGVPYGWAGENIARNSYPGSQAATIAHRDFMASPGHRDNILSTNFTHVGIAAAVDGAGITYFAIVFLSL